MKESKKADNYRAPLGFLEVTDNGSLRQAAPCTARRREKPARYNGTPPLMNTPILPKTPRNVLQLTPESLQQDFTERKARRWPARLARRRLWMSLDLPLLLFGFACFLRLHLGPSAMILSLSLKRSRSRVTSHLLLSPPFTASPLPSLSPVRFTTSPSPRENTWFATHCTRLRHHLLKHLSTWPLLLAAHGCVFSDSRFQTVVLPL